MLLAELPAYLYWNAELPRKGQYKPVCGFRSPYVCK